MIRPQAEMSGSFRFGGWPVAAPRMIAQGGWYSRPCDCGAVISAGYLAAPSGSVRKR